LPLQLLSDHAKIEVLARGFRHGSNGLTVKTTGFDGGSQDFLPAPIPSDWILEGTPKAQNKVVAISHDRTSYTVVWDCTAGHFNWHYRMDETLVVTSGQAFITDQKGEERRLGPGDVAFFPAGTSCTWRVLDRVRKVAFLRLTMPRPMGFCLRAWNKILGVVRLGGRSSLILAAAAWTSWNLSLKQMTID